MAYVALKQRVADRGQPPDAFLNELVAWGKWATSDIFDPGGPEDIYTAVFGVLGPWQGPYHRKAVMLEVMRVLAGFESSWKWNEGVDESKATDKIKDESAEAGAWQVSADSMDGKPELKELVLKKAGATDAITFQSAMKRDHQLAMEYIARLLRRTIQANGPTKRHTTELDIYLRRDAVAEFQALVSFPRAPVGIIDGLGPPVKGKPYYR